MQERIISTSGKSPTILTERHDGDGVVLFQGRNRVYLDSDEINNLLAALGRPPATSPAKARLQTFPVTTA
jgi:hypothetical protein